MAVVVPAYNEEQRILRTLQRLEEYYGGQSYTWSVAVVSDGSTDRTEEIVASFCDGRTLFSLLAYKPNRGKGHAVRKGVLAAAMPGGSDGARPSGRTRGPGFSPESMIACHEAPHVRGEIVLFCDADLATPQEETAKLLPFIEAGADVAIGSRPLKQSKLTVRQPWYREQLGRMANKVIQLLGVRGIKDTQCGFKMFRAEAAREIFSRCRMDGFSFDFEALMIARDLGYEVAEVPIEWAHQEGSKVVLWRDMPKALFDLVKLRLMGRKRRLSIKEGS